MFSDAHAKMITAIVGVAAAIPGVYNLITFRRRSKLKADIEMLDHLVKTLGNEKDKPNINPVALSLLHRALTNISEKVHDRTCAWKKRSDPYRKDTDWSSIFTGLSLGFATSIWFRTVVFAPAAGQKAAEPAQKTVAVVAQQTDTRPLPAANTKNSWQQAELWIVGIALFAFAVAALLAGIRRKYNWLRTIWRLPPFPPAEKNGQ